MFKHYCIIGVLAAGMVAGCKCKSTVVVDNHDSGTGSGGDGGTQKDGGNGGPPDGSFVGGDGGFFQGGGVGPGGFVLDGGNATGTGNGVSVDPDAGGIVLNSGNVQLHYAWIANNAQGWVSKYDTVTGNEVARYYSVIPIDGLGNAVNVKYNDYGSNSPSRTAIDLFGNAWVGNRAPPDGIQGSVTKIANSLADCVDRNGNGVIDTSTDLNGNGIIDANEIITPSNPADPKTYDECVLFSTPVGTTTGSVKVRAMAISQGTEGTAGDIWVGLWNNNEVLRLDSSTGKILPVTPNNANGPLSLPMTWGNGPYGAAVDGEQRLWIVHSPQGKAQLALIDTLTGTLISDSLVPPANLDPSGSYGMGVDGKNRVWIAAYGAGPSVFRYDNGPGLSTANGVWTKFDFSTARSAQGTSFDYPRGIAADDQGYVWVSGNSNGGGVGAAAILLGFNGDTGAIKKFGTADFIDATDTNSGQSIGVGIDSNENIWVNNYSGNVMRIDRNTGAVFKTTSLAGGTGQQPAGLYTYSDFTGYELRHFTAPRGTYQEDLQGCGPQTTFHTLSWDAIQAPPTTQIQVFVKVAATIAALNSPTTTQYGPFTTSPVDLQGSGVPSTFQYIRVIFVLTSGDHISTPVLKDFTVTWDCQGTIG